MVLDVQWQNQDAVDAIGQEEGCGGTAVAQQLPVMGQHLVDQRNQGIFVHCFGRLGDQSLSLGLFKPDKRRVYGEQLAGCLRQSCQQANQGCLIVGGMDDVVEREELVLGVHQFGRNRLHFMFGEAKPAQKGGLGV